MHQGCILALLSCYAFLVYIVRPYGLILLLVSVAFVFSADLAQADTATLDTHCDSLFHLAGNTETTKNPYLNAQTCAVYEDLFNRYANCTRIQKDGVQCLEAITSLNPDYATHLDQMLKALTAAGYDPTIISAYRKKPTANLAGSKSLTSNHYFGCAADITASGWSGDTTCRSKVCKAAQRIAGQNTLRSLGYYPEYNHFQPTGTMLAVCKAQGAGPSAFNTIPVATLSLPAPLAVPSASLQQSPLLFANYSTGLPIPQAPEVPVAPPDDQQLVQNLLPADQDPSVGVPAQVAQSKAMPVVVSGPWGVISTQTLVSNDSGLSGPMPTVPAIGSASVVPSVSPVYQSSPLSRLGIMADVCLPLSFCWNTRM